MRYSLIFFYFFVTVLLFSNVIIAQTTLDWVGAINGTDSNFGYDLDKDQNDNIYVCGAYVGSANFNLLTGSTLQTSNGSSDVFLAKYSKNGDLIWVKVFGGGINDAASRVKVGVNGAVYITGTFGGTVDFDPTSGTDNHTTVYREDVFVSKFDTAGNWIWTKTFGGNQNDKVNALETDSNGNIYLGGEFEETVDFNPGGATTSRTSTGGADGYILSLDSNGLYRWVSVVTGSQSSDEGIGGIKLNRSNELVVAEIIRGQLNYASVSKYNLSGALIWSKSFQNKSTQGGFVMIGDLEIEAIHTPGHTSCHTSFLLEELGILVTGDLFPAATTPGRTDFPTGNVVQMRDSIQRVQALDLDTLIPSRGETIRGNAIEESLTKHLDFFDSMIEAKGVLPKEWPVPVPTCMWWTPEPEW